MGRRFLILEDGTMQRRKRAERDPTIVAFERYAFDMAQLAGEAESPYYKPREKFMSELINPDPQDPFYKLQPGRFRAELHDRLSAFLYPLAFVVLAFAFMGQTKTTRQGRSAAIVMAGVSLLALRLAGFAASGLVVREPWALSLVYGLPLGAIGLGF